MERYPLDKKELQTALNELSGWQIVDGKLHREFKFGSFAEAMGWMVSAAIYADKLDHHPEWANVYNRVSVDLVTHDLGNVISSWDVALAKQMDALFR